MAWTVWVCDTVTGAKRQRMPMATFGWGCLLDTGAGQKTATVKLADATVKLLNVKSLTVPRANMFVLDWDGTAVYAGIITARSYDFVTQTWTFNHEDIWFLFADRLAVDHYVPDFSQWSATYANISLRQLAKNLVILGTSGPTNANITLPITLPADEAGTLTRTVYGYHMNGLVSTLQSVMAEDGGPDIYFQPRWVSGALNWLMRVGTPHLAVKTHSWNLQAPETGIAELTVTDDATKQVTNFIAVGEGTGTDTILQSNRISNPPIPHSESSEPYKTVSDRTQLDALAAGDLVTYGSVTTQLDFAILANGAVSIADLMPGDVARLDSKGDPVIPDGPNMHRITGYTGDLSLKIQMQIQPGGV